MTRLVSKADELKALGAQPIRADLHDRESLEFALRGVDTVVAAAHSFLGRKEEASEKVDDIGHRALIEASKKSDVKHFVYTSALGAASDHPVDFWRTKARIERYLQDSGLAHTIIRPAAFIDFHAYQLIGKAVIDGKTVMLIGPGRNPRNFVAADDVAKVIIGALRIPSLRGQAIDIGGPENLTAHQVIETFEKLSGKRAKVRHMPLTVARVMAKATGLVHPGISRVLRMGVVNETTDQTFDPTAFRSKVPVTLTTLESWARNRMKTKA